MERARWAVVAAALIASVTVLLPATSAMSDPAYEDVIAALDPVLYYRLGDAAADTGAPLDESTGSSSGSYWTGAHTQAFPGSTPPAPEDPGRVSFGVAGLAGFGGDDAVSFGSGTPSAGARIVALPFSGPSVSYEVWIKPSSLPATGTEANLLSVGGCCEAALPGVRMSLTSSGTVVAEAGRDLFREKNRPIVESTRSVFDGSWHQVVAVYHEESKSLWISIDGLVNGVRASEFAGLVWNHFSWGGEPLDVARPVDGRVQYVGAMDELSIYDKAITLEDIRTNYRASGEPIPPGWGTTEGSAGPGSDDTSILGPNAAKDWDELLRCHCADPVDTGSGNLHMPIASVSVPGREPGLDVSMAYNSLAAGSSSSIGYGWSSTLDMRLFNDTVLGQKTVVQETGATVAFHPTSSGWASPDGYTAKLEAVSGGDWLFTRNFTEQFRFDGAGRLKSIADQYGNTTVVSYPTNTVTDAAYRQASSLTDGANRSLTLAWNSDTAGTGAGKLVSITEPLISGQAAPRFVAFTYDANGNLATYKDVAGGTTVFTYDDAEVDPARHLMTKMRKPRQSDNNVVIENNFDAKGRVEWQEDELNRRTDFAYDSPSAGRTTVTMPPFNAAGDRHKRIDTYVDGVRTSTITAQGSPAEQQTDYQFDPVTNAPESITDNDGKETVFADSNGDGNIDSVTDPTDRTTRYTYGIYDQVTSIAVGEKGGNTSEVVTTAIKYDSTNGRLEKTTAAAGTADEAVTGFVYGDSGHPEDVTSVIDARGKEWKSGFDAGTGHLLWSENPEGERTVTTYNEIGWPTSVTSPQGVISPTPNDFQTTYTYNIPERSTTMTGPTGDITKAIVNANGNTTSVATGPTLGDITTYGYTDADELATVDPPGAGSKSYAYWPNGARRNYTSELGAVTQYGYDAGGGLLSETDPAGRVTTNTYDPVGRLKTVKQSVTGATCSGTKVGCITYFYDAAGRVTGVDYSDTATPDLVGGSNDYGTGVVYDGLGRRVTARSQSTSGSWTETWAWNKRSEITSHVDRNGTPVGYEWNKTGGLKKITYPGSKEVNRGFDDAGRLTSVTDWASRTSTFSYDDDSNWTGTAFGTVNNDVFAYDAAGRMTAATWKQGASELGKEIYTRPTSTKGMVDTLTASGPAGGADKNYEYDARDRLRDTAGVTDAGQQQFNLDDASNLLKGPGGQNQAFNLAQQLCWTSSLTASAAGTTTACPTAPTDATVYGSDELGRRSVVVSQDEDRRTHAYDQASRLTGVVDDNTGTNNPSSAMSDTPITGDFDHDGQDDVMAYRAGGTSDDPVWWGTDRETFGTSTDSYNVAGDFTPLSGDFNGDGFGDILWYKPGTGTDYVWFWYGRANNQHHSVTATIDATDYTPFTGDFDGDGKTDIYWYRAGTGADWIWFGDANADNDNHTYVQDSENVSGSYLPVTGDFDDDGKDEIFWYGPGATADSVWDFTSRTAHDITSKTVGGSNYLPVAGDFDGDGNDDLVFNDWTANGGDTLWWGPGLSASSQKAVSLNAGQLPFAGDFDGDGKDELFVNQYNAGGDTIWWGTTRTGFSTTDIGFAPAATTLDATYTYDADGTRATKTVNGDPQQKFTYTSGTGLPMLLTQQSGTDNTYVIYGPGDQPIEQVNVDGSAVWLHHDQLGSVRLATRATDGAEYSRRTFDAYGTTATEAVTTAGTKQPLLGYAGQYTDTETGYQYLRARYYDPATGGFLTKDPLVAQTEEPYGYAGGNPVAYTDPTGHEWYDPTSWDLQGCPQGRNADQSCIGAQAVRKYADDVSAIAGGLGAACTATGALLSEFVLPALIGGGCAAAADLVSVGAGVTHAAVTCADLDKYCRNSAAAIGVNLTGAGVLGRGWVAVAEDPSAIAAILKWCGMASLEYEKGVIGWLVIDTTERPGHA